MLQRAPTGIPWNMIPFAGATAQEMLAEQTNICWRASNDADRVCNQPLRATFDVEEEVGPDFRVTSHITGATLLASRWPILGIVGGQWSPAATFPPAWSPIPGSAMRARTQLIGTYGTSAPGAAGSGPSEIQISPGYLPSYAGRDSWRVQVAYINGWPHAGITANVAANATTVPIDDVTGMAGASVFIYDDANTEVVQVASVAATNPISWPEGVTNPTTVQVGPGVATLVAPLQFAHDSGVIFSSLPQDIGWAVINLAAAQVLDAGAQSVQMGSLSGGKATSAGGASGLRQEAHLTLRDYARIV